MLLLAWTAAASAQPYDLVLQGGRVIDPANGIAAVMDVAISGGKIARVAADIPGRDSRRVLSVKGLYVTPGLVDLHTHVYTRGRTATVTPDDAVLPHGVTTIVDAGVSGARNFDDFKATIIDRARTRVLALINIVAGGMNDDIAKEYIVADMDPAAAAAKIRQYPSILVGVKTAHFGPPGWIAVERAVAAGRLADVPVMLDSSVYSNSGRDTRTKVLEKMRPGDIHTHAYNDHQVEITSRFTGKVQPWMWEARKRGVLFDLGHGGGSFLWPVASAAMAGGFPPDTLGTDLHTGSILSLRVNVLNTRTKLMALGMSVEDAVARATVNPAKAIRRFPAIGTLGEGREADIAVFEMRQGVFALVDSIHKKLTATRNLAGVMTIRAGRIVFDRDGLSLESAGNSPSLAPLPRPGPAPPPEGDSGEIVFDLLLKNGTVIRPGRLTARLDIGISGGKVRRIAPSIPARFAKLAADLDGYYLTPGLIDARADVNNMDRPSAVTVDHHSLRHGVTAVVDPASTPAIVRRSRVRLIAGPRSPMPADALASGLDQTTALEGASLGRTMTLLLNQGVPFERIVARATRIPAAALPDFPNLGRLEANLPADLAVFEIVPGPATIPGPDRRRTRIAARVQCILTLRNGDVAWDLHGLTLREWTQAGGYGSYK